MAHAEVMLLSDVTLEKRKVVGRSMSLDGVNTRSCDENPKAHLIIYNIECSNGQVREHLC